MLAYPSLHGRAPSSPPSRLHPCRSRGLFLTSSSCRCSPRPSRPCLRPISSFRSLRIKKWSLVRASVDSQQSEGVLESSGDGVVPGPRKYSVKIPVGNRHILVETGHIGRQASASVMVTDGETANEMSKCLPPPSKKLSQYAPLIHVMKVKPEKINLIIGSGGKKVKSIIEETGVEAIDTQDDGLVKITARDLLSLEKSKAIIANLTMVPTIGDVYRNCEIKSIAPYGVFVEIVPGREGLCHISELSTNWLSKADDVFKVGDRIDVKLIEINEKGHLRLSHRVLLPDINPEKSGWQQTSSSMKENIPPQDGVIKIATRKPLRKNGSEHIGAPSENAKIDKDLQKKVKTPVKDFASEQGKPAVKKQEFTKTSVNIDLDKPKKSNSTSVTGMVTSED